MNKKHVIIDIIFVFFLSLTILLASFLTTFFVSTNEAKSNLTTYGNEIALLYKSDLNDQEVKDKFGQVIDIRITILKLKDGKPVLDINPNENSLSNEDRFLELKNNLNSFYEKKSLTTGYDTLYYVTKNDNYFVRVGLPISEIRDVSFNVLIYGTISVVILNIAYGSIKFYFYKKNITSLKCSLNDLESVIQIPSLGQNDDGIDILNRTIKKIKHDFKCKINELEMQKHQNDFVLDSIEEGFIVIDDKQNVSIINRYALEVLDIHKDEIINKNYVFLALGNELNEKIMSINGDNVTTFDVKLNGKIYLFIANKVNYIDGINTLKTPIAITFFDVTSTRLNETIKREFFQNASHELKTPLTTIIGYEGLINNGLIEDKDELSQANDIILKEAQRMKSVIDDMLILSKLESDSEKTYENINVKEVTQYVLDSMKLIIDSKHIDVITNLSDCVVKAEKGDLDRLVRNLVSNAIKYNNENGKLIITLNNHFLKVSDTGFGISQNDIPRIFERFYRVDKGRSRELGGTGLGLAIVKHITIKYGYKINVTSKLGRGTTFTIYFDNKK